MDESLDPLIVIQRLAADAVYRCTDPDLLDLILLMLTD